MSNEEKERRCKSCGKLLVDEKLFCRRCVLEGRNTAGKITGAIGGAVMSVLSVAALVNNNSNDTDTQ